MVSRKRRTAYETFTGAVFSGALFSRRLSMLWILQNYVVSLLRDKGGANAVEYALIMALVAVFIIAGVLAMSGAIGALFNSMASCLGDAPGCNTGTF